MRFAISLLAFAASAFAYQVLTPNGSQGWTNQGSQTLTWQRVASDRLNFTVLLTNQAVSGYEPQNLAALVDGNLGSIALNPPSGGWPTGSKFRLNLVQDNQNLNAILAQSPEFSIAPSTSTSAKTSTTPGTGTVAPPATVTDNSPSPSDTLLIPTNAAMGSYSANTGLIAVFSLLGFAFA